MNSNHHPSCPICGSGKKVHMHQYAACHLVKCKSCSMIYAERIPANQELENHYKNYSRGRYVSDLTIQKYRELLGQFGATAKNRRVLDVGCGSGFFLETAKKAGWQAIGTEFGNESIAHCREKDIEVYEGDILRIDLPKESFDVITSFEVIEHLSDPKSHIQRLYELLAPGGILYITTPNMNAITRYILKDAWSIISYPEHLSYFSPKTLNKLLCQEGLTKKWLRADGLSVDRLVNHFKKKKVVSENESPDKAKVKLTNESVRQASQKYVLIRLLRGMIDGILNVSRSGEFLKGFYIKSK